MALQTPEFYASRLREYAKVLRMGNFSDPPAILSDLAAAIDARQISRQMLDDDYKRLLGSLWREFSQETWQLSVLNDADAFLTRGPIQIFLQARQMLDDTIRPQTTCNQVFYLAASQQDRTLRMHLLGFSYLILTEGVYDTVMRFLYALHLNLGAVTTELKDIVARFRADHVGISLLDVWNPTVRNAIGHATYLLNTENETIEFQDRRASAVANLSFDDFRILVEKMVHVGVAVSILLIVRVLVPMNFGEVSTVLGL